MERFEGEQLICVDPYCQYEELPASRECDRLTAVMALMPWHGRVRFYNCTGDEAAKAFPWWLKQRLDFVYIDAVHTFDAAFADMETWWWMLSDQGILAGHDYDDTHPGVRDAVNAFASKHNVLVRLVAGDSPESWYIYKHEPSELMRVFFEETTIPNLK